MDIQAADHWPSCRTLRWPFVVLLLLLTGADARSQILEPVMRVRVLKEISQLDQALQNYRTIANSYPPCMGDATIVSRHQRFYYHVVRAFPRFIVGDLNPDGVRNYLDQRQCVLINFNGKAGQWYDLDTMDQAEALVFWLGGFPTPRLGGKPTGELLGSSKLLGFCASPTAPFFDAPGKPLGVFTTAEATALNTVDRSKPLFQFDEARLVDQDQDGWLEYIPPLPESKGIVPPYVYFDGDLYSKQETPDKEPPFRPYPSAATADLSMLGPATDKSAAAWGAAVPYAAALPPTSKSQMMWVNARKFQILCAGWDKQYGQMGETAAGYSENLPKIYPNGIRYDPKNGDRDNLTNFADAPLGDSVEPKLPKN